MDAGATRLAGGPLSELIPRGKMVRGMAWFVALTVAGLGTLWHFTARGEARDVVAAMSGAFLALAVLSAAADILIGAVRYQVFLRRIRPGTSLWLPVRADLANRFVGAVTPSQTGGGPAQVFILWRGGIPVPDALSFLLINFLSTLVFFLVAGGAAAWVFRERFAGGGIHLLVRYGFVAFAGCLAVMLVGLLRPDWVAAPTARMAASLEGRTGAVARIGWRCGRAVAGSLDQYRAACTRFIREDPLLPVLSFALTVLLYLNKFTLAWLVMRGLGVEGDYGTTLAVQALLHFILYVAPSPGGSGIAELSTGALMAILMPAHLLAPFTLAYRLFLLYLPAAAGALVILRELRPARAGRHEPARAAATGVVMLGVAATLFAAPGASAQVAMPEVSTQADPVSRAQARVKDLVVQGLRAPDTDSAKVLYEASVDVARALVSATPDDAEAHYLLSVAPGYHLEHQGLRRKFGIAAEVRTEAERALELDPSHPGAHHVLGRLHAGAMRLNRVARFILREVLGASVLEGASWDQAEAHFRTAWEHDPGSPRHAMELGALYRDTDRPDQALEVLRRASVLVPREASDSLAAQRVRALLVELGSD
ncbi:MAG: hypothetical protein AMXMBFR53_06830 [Gemmatimonadota bacterium]